MNNKLNKIENMTDFNFSNKSKIIRVGTTSDFDPKDLTLFSCLKNTCVFSKILDSTSSSTNKNVELMNKLIKNS